MDSQWSCGSYCSVVAVENSATEVVLNSLQLVKACTSAIMQHSVAAVQFGPNNTAGNRQGYVTTQHCWSIVSKSWNVVIAGVYCQNSVDIDNSNSKLEKSNSKLENSNSKLEKSNSKLENSNSKLENSYSKLEKSNSKLETR